MVRNTKAAYVFPGQGSQAVGMGLSLYRDHPAAKSVFDEVDATLGFSLSRLCFEGPEDVLTQTINVQPAILTVSIACLKAAQETIEALPPPDMVAGHSLGEYTALAAAGSLSVADAVRLVRERGRLMNEAGHITSGGMLAVIGMNEEIISAICQSAGVEIANINSPDQIVVSGAQENLAQFRKLAEKEGARRMIPLKVSGAFHSRLMKPAVDGLKQAIERCTFAAPSVPVVANVTAQPLTSATAIKQELTNQILNCVQWQRSVENMIANGVTAFFEIGHGAVLTNLIKRINPNVQVTNIGDA